MVRVSKAIAEILWICVTTTALTIAGASCCPLTDQPDDNDNMLPAEADCEVFDFSDIVSLDGICRLLDSTPESPLAGLR